MNSVLLNRSVTANTGKGIHSVEEIVEQEECFIIHGLVAVIDIKYVCWHELSH